MPTDIAMEFLVGFGYLGYLGNVNRVWFIRLCSLGQANLASYNIYNRTDVLAKLLFLGVGGWVGGWSRIGIMQTHSRLGAGAELSNFYQ